MFVIIITVLVLFIAIYCYNVRNFDYWKKRGVKGDKPVVFFGTIMDIYLHKKSITQITEYLYFKYPNEKVVGTFRSSQPGLVIRDPELIKRVINTDFSYFHRRGIFPSETLEPLLRNLFFAEGDIWRLLRQRITPAFTSGKLKAMFPLIIERAEQLQLRTLKAAKNNKTIDARDLMARYTTDFIGSCGFGLDACALNDENSPFRKLGVDIFSFGIRETLIIILKDFFPQYTKNIKFLGKIEKEVIDLVLQIQKQRNYEPSNRNDFIDILLELKKKGAMVGESIERRNEDGTPCEARIELDDLVMAAQVLVFFAAGFETSSSATSYTLHQLAYNPEVQKKVQNEIDSVLSNHNNKLSYESVKEMTYLEWTFKEGLRMFPSLGYLRRMCAKKYTFPEINLTIDEGVSILIPVQALHRDPHYWIKPEKFRPERFHPDEFTEMNKNVYLPFGSGPRACIGEWFYIRILLCY